MVNLKDHDMGEGMQCLTHPYTKNPGGICALCLQDKLGKLVTSSFPLSKPNHPSSSSSSANLIYKRSKSTAASYGESFRQRKRSGFWSFLHLYSSRPQVITKKVDNSSHSSRPRNQIDNGRNQTTETSNQVVGGGTDVIAEEEDESPSNKVVVETPTNSVGGSSFGRKVLRSRSVGCGNRSFSSERISNEFGDCALRRIESQREPTKVISNGGDHEAADAMSEMVKCGGIFGGFMIMTPSSSTVDHHHHKMGNRSAWGWVSPMRAKTTQRGRTITKSSTDKKTSPKLDSVPSLVTMKS
ncbi:hypothetical protein N665_0385s0003 [Sinapis alba]|nr:hypothetical protein N665_0385s0003 [Sinapis alba]